MDEDLDPLDFQALLDDLGPTTTQPQKRFEHPNDEKEFAKRQFYYEPKGKNLRSTL